METRPKKVKKKEGRGERERERERGMRERGMREEEVSCHAAVPQQGIGETERGV